MTTSLAIKNFIQYISIKLNPAESSYIYKGRAVEFKVQAGYASVFKGTSFYIRNNDISWNLPSTIFDGVQAQASDKQEIKVEAIKWLSFPILHSLDYHPLLETNVSTLTVRNTAGQELSISGLTNPVETRIPYRPTGAFDDSLLRCTFWDDPQHEFSDASCGLNFMNAQLPCLNCDPYSIVTAPIALCRCNHLSIFVVSYLKTNVS